MRQIPYFTLDKHLFFGRILEKIRVWKIKRYKSKKVKVEAKNSPDLMYHLHFKIAIRDKSGLATCDGTVFDISIPASGYFFAKRKLERYIVRNIDIEIVNFESEEIKED